MPISKIQPIDRFPKEEPPPILGSWRRLYVATLVYLVFLLVLLAAASFAFHY